MYNSDLWLLHADQITRDQWKRTLWPSFRHLTLQLSHPRSGLHCVHSPPAHPTITLHLQSVVLCCALSLCLWSAVLLVHFSHQSYYDFVFWVYIQKYLTFPYCLFISVVLLLCSFLTFTHLLCSLNWSLAFWWPGLALNPLHTPLRPDILTSVWFETSHTQTPWRSMQCSVDCETFKSTFHPPAWSSSWQASPSELVSTLLVSD